MTWADFHQITLKPPVGLGYAGAVPRLGPEPVELTALRTVRVSEATSEGVLDKILEVLTTPGRCFLCGAPTGRVFCTSCVPKEKE